MYGLFFFVSRTSREHEQTGHGNFDLVMVAICLRLARSASLTSNAIPPMYIISLVVGNTGFAAGLNQGVQDEVNTEFWRFHHDLT